MNNEAIQSLLDALAISPDNIPLRLHVAELLLHEKRHPEAVEQYQTVLQKSYGNVKAQSGLAESYFALEAV